MVKIIDQYTLTVQIGSGNYGSVFKASHQTKSGQFAVKIIPVEKLQLNKKLEEFTINEARILNSIDHCEHIVKYHEMLKTKNNYYFVYEYCNGGTLYDLIKAEGRIQQPKVLSIFQQLLEAFKVLRKHSIMHRDIKPENILFKDGVVKLGDFGFCKGLEPDEDMTKTMLGSPLYMAPEVLRGQPYSAKADIWSLGVILYEMLYGHCPFESRSIAMLIDNINKIHFTVPPDTPDHRVSQKTKRLIPSMLTKDPSHRIEWDQLFSSLSHHDPSTPSSLTSPNSDHFNEDRYYLNQSKYTTKSKTINLPRNIQNPIETRKNTSIVTPKPQAEEKKRVFYSQNYMGAFRSPLNKDKKVGQAESPFHEDTQRISNFSMSIPDQGNNFLITSPEITTNASITSRAPSLIENQSFQRLSFGSSTKKNARSTNHIYKDKKKDLIEQHRKCVAFLHIAVETFESNNCKSALLECYQALLTVQKEVKSISGQIQLTEFGLDELQNVVSNQSAQLDRQLFELRDHLIQNGLEIPKQEITSQVI